MKLNLSLTPFALMFLALCTSCSPEETEEPVQANYVVEISNISVDNKLSMAVLHEVNAHRESVGLEKLAWKGLPFQLAAQHSNYMAQIGDLDHDNFNERAQYLMDQGAQHVSENVAFGYVNAHKVVDGWLNSPDHREAIEGDFNFTGIAVVENDEGVPYYTQIFIKQ